MQSELFPESLNRQKKSSTKCISQKYCAKLPNYSCSIETFKMQFTLLAELVSLFSIARNNRAVSFSYFWAVKTKQGHKLDMYHYHLYLKRLQPIILFPVLSAGQKQVQEKSQDGVYTQAGHTDMALNSGLGPKRQVGSSWGGTS